MPCHVPNPRRPPLTGTCRQTPLSMALTWAGMSSGPSVSCTQPAFSGATRRKAVTRSVCTSGSAFSWITSDAEVWRRNSSRMPSAALASSTKRDTSRVMSKKPSPLVGTVSSALAIVSARATWMGDTRVTDNSAPCGNATSALVHHLVLRVDNRFEKLPPHLPSHCDHPVDVGTAGQPDHDLRLLTARRGLRHGPRRQRQAVRKQFGLECGVVPAQPGNFILKNATVLGRSHARPAHRLAAAQRHFAGLGIEPQKAVRDFVEAIARLAQWLRRVAGRRGRGQ